MNIRCIWEHNGNDTLLYTETCVGAYTRGSSLASAWQKMENEIRSYLAWAGEPVQEPLTFSLVQEQESTLQICDADSDVLFDAEREPLTVDVYEKLKMLALKSAADFYTLYASIPDPHQSCLPARKTFYGVVPRTAAEMYEHTKNVNAYYFGELGIEVSNDGGIEECRRRGFWLLEQTEGYLDNPVYCGSYEELWSLRKLLRRFLWHDRIHAKAMYRMAVKTFGAASVENVFGFLMDAV